MSDRELDTHRHVFEPRRKTGCQAFAERTGEQCRARCRNGFCAWHKQQKGKCCAITCERKRCLGFITKAGRGYFCEHHEDWATPKEAVCKGHKLDGTKCYRRAPDPKYRFCSTKHDKRIRYCNPEKFRKEYLRYQVLDRLRNRDGDRDRYNKGRTTYKVDRNQVDHIVEAQMFSYCYQFNIFEDAEKKDLIEFARDEFANTLPNLLVTRKATNRGKGLAVANSLEDLRIFSMKSYGRLTQRSLKDLSKIPIITTFDDRLLEQKLKCDSTRAIRREMGKPLRDWQDKCLEQGESPVYKKLGKIAGEMFTVFDLHVSSDSTALEVD